MDLVRAAFELMQRWELVALGLLVLAAGMHAVWNVMIKRAREKQVFTWWALLIGSICFSPFLHCPL